MQDVNNIKAMRYLEKEIGYKRGKGGKFKNSIEIEYEVPDDKIDETLKKFSEQDEHPKIIVIFNSGNVVLTAVVADSRVISVKETDIVHAIIVMIGLYYICDMKFPRCYGQFLGMLQEVAIKEKYSGSTSTGFYPVDFIAGWKC